MAIKLPKELIESGYKFEACIPAPRFEMEKNANGSISCFAKYDTSELFDLPQRIARDINEKIDAALIDELLRLNGYVPEKTCRMEYSKERGGVFCSNCGEEMNAYTCEWYDAEPIEYSYPFCYECGAKVVNYGRSE